MNNTVPYLRLVVDNTNVVPKQPFEQPIITTRDDMEELRSMFDEWLNKQGELNQNDNRPIFVHR